MDPTRTEVHEYGSDGSLHSNFLSVYKAIVLTLGLSNPLPLAVSEVTDITRAQSDRSQRKFLPSSYLNLNFQKPLFQHIPESGPENTGRSGG